MRQRSLRSHLVLLVLVAVVPLLAFAAVLVVLETRHARATAERGLRDTTRALVLAVDRQMNGLVRTLEALAASEDIDKDLADFYRHIERVRASQPWWRVAFLASATGDLLYTTGAVGQPPVPAIRDREHFRRMVATRSPAYSDFLVNFAQGAPGVSIVVPVIRNEHVWYGVGAAVDLEAFNDFLEAQGLPHDWIGLVLDGANRVLGRTGRGGPAVGEVWPLGEAAEAGAGWFRTAVDEGRPVYVAYSRSEHSGWTVAVQVPAATVDAPMWSALGSLAAAGSVFILVGVVLALVWGHRVAAPLAALARSAEAVGRGASLAAPASPVTEIDRVARAIEAAGRERAHFEAALVERERDARALAEREQQARNDAEERRREAELLAELAQAINASLEPDVLLPRVAAAARALCRSDAAGLALRVRGTDTMAVRYGSAGLLPIHRDLRIRPGRGLGGLAWTLRRPVRTDDYGNDPRFTKDYLAVVRATNVVAQMAAPILIDGRVEGLLYVDNHTDRPFDDSDERILVRLAAHAGIALRNADLLARAEAARAEAERASRAKDEFLAMLGHELRNPLSAITSAVRVVTRAGLGDARGLRAAEVIERQAQHLARLLEDLLDVARVTTGRIVLSRRRVDLAQIAARTLETLQASGRTEAHRVSLDAAPVWIDGDPTRLEQVTSNLVVNALKYTPPGGSIRVSVHADGDEAVLAVADTGVGMTPEILDRVWDLFFQASMGSEHGRGGLGIGLTLVRRLVELHGGRVGAASDGPGHGSTFTVRLPRRAMPAPEDADEAGAGAMRTRRIVIVEDNADAREMLRAMLELAGHEVHEAADGPSGVEAILRVRPDVAIVDIGLPGLDGYGVARAVRTTVPEGTVLLVALTGYGRSEDRQRVADAGFDAHLIKPVDPDRLARVL